MARHSAYALALSWLVSLGTGLMASGLLCVGFVLTVLALELSNGQLAADGLVLLGLGFATFGCFVSEFKATLEMTWPHESEPTF